MPTAGLISNVMRLMRRGQATTALLMSLLVAFLAFVAANSGGDAASLKAGHVFDDRLIVTMRTTPTGGGEAEKTSSAALSTSRVFAMSTVLGVQSATVLSDLSPVVLLKLEMNSSGDTNRVIKEVSSMDGVLHVERDSWVSKFDDTELRPNDAMYSRLYGMEKLQMPKAWSKYGTGSQDIVVCVIDTGYICVRATGCWSS